jgi:hypothetical protein
VKIGKEDKMIELLEELVKWTKVTSIPNVKKILTAILVKPEEKIAYQASDGKKTIKQVAKRANVATGTVSGWWKKWAKVGIVEAFSVAGGTRAKRVFSLDDFGIEVPVIKVTTEEKGKNGDKTA